MTHRGKIMKNLLNKSQFLSLALFLGFILPTSHAVLADTVQADEPRTITVTGMAKKEYEPDILRISLTLVSRDRELTVAKRLNDEQLDRLLEVTKKFKIAKTNVVTSNIHSNPEYNRSRQNQRRLVGYTITRKIRILVENTDIQEDLMAGFVDAEINQVNDVRFDLSNPHDKQDELRIAAYADAKRKAHALAKVASSRLGNALHIQANASPVYRAPYRGLMSMAADGSSMEDGSAPKVDGSVILQESVKVVFELVTK